MNLAPQNFIALSVIESLRSGIPTKYSTQELPNLRESLQQQINQDLTQLASSKRPKGRLLWGGYGQGKTHALTAIEHLALSQGFAVSRITLNREVSCHSIYKFYERVATAIRTPNSKITGIQSSLNNKYESDLKNSPFINYEKYTHPLPALILQDYYYAFGLEQETLYNSLIGTPVSITEIRKIHRSSRSESFPTIGKFNNNQHAKAYYEVMSEAITWCGYKGWVILIDEVELIGRLGKVSRLSAYLNLNWLLNWSNTMQYPIYTVGVVASNLKSELWFKSLTNGDKEIDIIPKLAAEKYDANSQMQLKNFFDTGINEIQCPTLQPLTQHQLIQLLEKLVIIHSQAYNWNPQINLMNILNLLGNKPIRTHIRATLEHLDLKYIHGIDIIPETITLTESSVAENPDFFT